MADTTDTMTSGQRRIAALSRWDKVADRSAETRPMRDGRLAKLRAEVLEEFPGLTDEAEITSRVERKLKLHYERMRLSSLKTRKANAAAKRQAALDALAEAIAVVESGADESARDSDETAA
jgi:hypothetical protein